MSNLFIISIVYVQVPSEISSDNIGHKENLFGSQRDFIIQTGDPTGTGRGGDSVFWSVITASEAFF